MTLRWNDTSDFSVASYFSTVLNNERPFFAKFLCERKLKVIEKYHTNVSYDGKCFDCINSVEIAVDLTDTCKIFYKNHNVYNIAHKTNVVNFKNI